MNRQLSHHLTPLSAKRTPLLLICDGVSGPANMGGLLRLCEAFAVEEILFAGFNSDLGSPRFRKTARNAQVSVKQRAVKDLTEEISTLKQNDYFMLGLEITNRSVPIQQLEIPENRPIALIIGGGRHGISIPVLQLLDKTVHIEMFGANSSMNVTQATAIALFELSKT